MADKEYFEKIAEMLGVEISKGFAPANKGGKSVKFKDMEEGKDYTYLGLHYTVRGGLLYSSSFGDYSRLRPHEILRAEFKEVKPGIPDKDTPVDTLVRVRDSVEDGWVERRFVAYLPKAEYKFMAFGRDRACINGVTATSWRYAEIIK